MQVLPFVLFGCFEKAWSFINELGGC